MKTILRASLLMAVFVLCHNSAAAQAGAQAACTPKFVAKGNWLGSDIASSIPLADGRTFWIFGDTLYGSKRAVDGQDPQMVRNSVGVSTCKNGQWDIHYTVRNGKDGKSTDYFAPRSGDTWYWPLDGVVYRGDLWISLLCIRSKPTHDSFTFGFELCGTDLAHISGTNAANPGDWKVSYAELVPDGTKSYPSASMVLDGEYVYIFSQNEAGDRPLVATRILGDKLNDARKNLEYLAWDGTWKQGFDPKNAKAVMKTGMSELSIRYHSELKKWVAVMLSTELPTDKIILRTADSVLGPWSEGQTIYRIPELQKNNPGYDVDTYCYAAKEHPEFEKPGDLVFTYVCNLAKPSKLMSMENIYYPQTVKMKMPQIQ